MLLQGLLQSKKFYLLFNRNLTIRNITAGELLPKEDLHIPRTRMKPTSSFWLLDSDNSRNCMSLIDYTEIA